MSENGKIHVKSNKVVLPRELQPEQGETQEAGFETAAPAIIKDLVIKDSKIESHAYRENFKPGDGDISIIITAGDELGDLRVTVQYEGEIEQYTKCLVQQGELIQQTADWLREIFAGFGGDWDADVLSAPCDKGDTRLLRLGELVERLQGPATDASVVHDHEVTATRQVRPHAGVNVDVGPKK